MYNPIRNDPLNKTLLTIYKKSTVCTKFNRKSITLQFKTRTIRAKDASNVTIRLSIQIPENDHDRTFTTCYNHQAFPYHQSRCNDHTKT